MNEEKRTTGRLKMAKSTPEEMEKMLRFFEGLENIFNGEFEHSDWGDYEGEQRDAIGKYVTEWWETFLAFSWGRFYWGFSTVLENAVDSSLDFLDFKPEIKRAIELLPEFVKLADSVEAEGEMDVDCPFCHVVGDREHRKWCLVMTARDLMKQAKGGR